MLGATYGGHLYTGPGRIVNEQPTHPIVKHWGAASSYSDEFYRAGAVSRDKVDVLLGSIRRARRRRLPADGDFPLVWTKTYGRGRVVYSSLSHSTEAWDIRNLQIMMFEAIKWLCAGGTASQAVNCCLAIGRGPGQPAGGEAKAPPNHRWSAALGHARKGNCRAVVVGILPTRQ